MAVVLRLLCLAAALGAYLCSSGLLRLNEVFFQSSVSSSSALDAQDTPHYDPQQREAAYDRLVVVLIDALRADMVLGSSAMRDGEAAAKDQQEKAELNAYMPFTSGLVASGTALGYVAHASVPTVTMPRLKALVTGKAPAFIDILKNFNSAALGDDSNLVSLLAASGKRIVFYGDDTWLKLFPETFKRSDGTSGFYTRDTVEVDNNVTRHLKEELDPTMQNDKSGDWDALVLHYLGLDHVGHLRGPRSSMMKDKLQEMDGVVQRVVESVRKQDEQRLKNDETAKPSLILLCSDHGMSEVGNHGGATLEESSALLMFMRGDGKALQSLSTVSYRQKRSQVDLVPTISALFGLPIPLYSTGLLLDDVVRASSELTLKQRSYYLRELYRNFVQLYELAMIKFHASDMKKIDEQYRAPVRQLRETLEGGESDANIEELAATMREACQTLQTKVGESDGSEYNISAIFSGLVLLFSSCAIVFYTRKRDRHGLSATKTADTHDSHSNNPMVLVLGVGSVLQIASLSSSSSIENEHATAFFMATTLLFALGLHLLRQQKLPSSASSTNGGLISVGSLLILTRMLRSRNQVINFWRLNGLYVDASLPGNEFATDDSVSILSTGAVFPQSILSTGICVVSITGIALWKVVHSVLKLSKPEKVTALCSCLVFVVAMVANCQIKSLDQSASEVNVETPWLALDADASARVVYGGAICLATVILLAKRGLRILLAEMIVWLLVVLLQRENNLQTLCFLSLQMEVVARLLKCKEAASLRQSGAIIGGLAVWLSQTAFFALGNSHLVTTIDISQSYHGLSSYSQGLVGALTFVSVYSGPLVCFVNLFQWLDYVSSVQPTMSLSLSPLEARQSASLAIFAYQTLRFTVYTIVVYFMRFHLFIWSVFAPKMLYEVAHLAVSLVVVSMLTVSVTEPPHHKQ